MSRSTVFMPCNVSGMFDPAIAGRYGIADFDWSNGKLTPDGRGWQQAKPMDTGAVLIEQAAQVKAANPRTHVWVYRQLVKALPWYKDIGEKMADPRYSGWFLPFRKGGASDLRNGSWHVPPCTGGLCSSLYHSQDQVQPDGCNGTCDCSGVPCAPHPVAPPSPGLVAGTYGERASYTYAGVESTCGTTATRACASGLSKST